jgi:hypothetical protein
MNGPPHPGRHQPNSVCREVYPAAPPGTSSTRFLVTVLGATSNFSRPCAPPAKYLRLRKFFVGRSLPGPLLSQYMDFPTGILSRDVTSRMRQCEQRAGGE